MIHFVIKCNVNNNDIKSKEYRGRIKEENIVRTRGVHMAKSLPLVDSEVKNTAFIFVSPKQLHNCIYLGEISPYVRYS